MLKTEGMLSCIGVNIGDKLLSKFIYLVSALRVWQKNAFVNM